MGKKIKRKFSVLHDSGWDILSFAAKVKTFNNAAVVFHFRDILRFAKK